MEFSQDLLNNIVRLREQHYSNQRLVKELKITMYAFYKALSQLGLPITPPTYGKAYLNYKTKLCHGACGLVKDISLFGLRVSRKNQEPKHYNSKCNACQKAGDYQRRLRTAKKCIGDCQEIKTLTSFAIYRSIRGRKMRMLTCDDCKIDGRRTKRQIIISPEEQIELDNLKNDSIEVEVVVFTAEELKRLKNKWL